MYENLKKGESTQKNIQKQKLKVQRLHHKIDNIRTDYINKSIAEIVKTKPSYITIENLNVSGMMKNRHLSKAVVSQKFYEFRTKLKAKCDENGIELRVVDRWYPSSKICHCFVHLIVATQNVFKYTQTHREIKVLADTSYCFDVYALAIVNNTLLTSSCTLHSRKFLR